MKTCISDAFNGTFAISEIFHILAIVSDRTLLNRLKVYGVKPIVYVI